MRVLVTGACGFIGHHVVGHILQTTDHDVVGLDRIDVTSTLSRLKYVGWGGPRTSFVWHDLRSPINSLVAAQIGRVDVILHLGASTHVDRSIDDPSVFILDNVLGTTHILDFARRDKAKTLYFSTDEVFGPAHPGFIGFPEDAAYRSSNPYSAAKAGGEELAIAYANTYGIPVAITHCMNVFGERQHPEKFVPLVIRKILHGEEILIHADAKCEVPGSRMYLHASQVAEIVTGLVAHDAFHTSAPKYNIVGAIEINNLDMVHRVQDALRLVLGDGFCSGPKTKLVDFHGSRPGHDLRYALHDAHTTLWHPWIRAVKARHQEMFDAQLRETVKWYVHNPEWLECP